MTKKKVFLGFVSILLVAVFALPGPSLDASAGLFDSPVPTPVPNDNFDSAYPITALPFQHYVNTWEATVEDGEPTPSCAEDGWGKTVWYAYTPEESGKVTARAPAWFNTGLAAYAGDSITELSEIGCSAWAMPLTLDVEPDTTYYFQVGGFWSEGGELWFSLEVTPPPWVDFSWYPDQPSEFDTIGFGSSYSDPAEVGIESWLWDLGDGTTSDEEGWTEHCYATEGDFTVTVTVTTFDGRTGSTTKEVQVRTHDVAIVKFGAAASATAGQTRALIVGLSNTRYPEQVEVRLYKGVPGDWNPYQLVGSLTQEVPVRPANRTTDFKFSYTFSSEDAEIGKVTFKAVAELRNARDALPADNEAISKPTKVRP